MGLLPFAGRVVRAHACTEKGFLGCPYPRGCVRAGRCCALKLILSWQNERALLWIKAWTQLESQKEDMSHVTIGWRMERVLLRRAASIRTLRCTRVLMCRPTIIQSSGTAVPR